MENKVYIVGHGGVADMLTQAEIEKLQGMKAEIITQQEADNLLGYRSKEVQELAFVLPKAHIYNPPKLSRRERRKKERQQRKKL